MSTSIILESYSAWWAEWNNLLIPAILAIVGIVCFGILYYKANKIVVKHRKQVQQDIINKAIIDFPCKEYYVACAGSNETNTCEKVSTININACNLCDTAGNPLDLSLYDCYIVHGDSMTYAGIKDNDFILVAKGFVLSDLTELPEILVIRYREENLNKPRYKVRRAWYIGTIEDNLQEVAKKIMAGPKFQKLCNVQKLLDRDQMVRDLVETRLKNYKSLYFNDDVCPDEYKKILISTTFDTVKKEIHFSIHSVSLIVGIVKESYTIR